MSGVIYALTAVFIIIADQITKLLAVKYLMPIDTFPIIEDVLHLTYVENRGAAFGILQNQRWVFIVISVVMIVLLAFVMIKLKKDFHPIMMTGLSFVIGGGIGNMIDRSLVGYVVDFIDFTLIDFAVFNIADTFICIGVGLLILDILLGKSNLSFLDGKKSDKENENGTETD